MWACTGWILAALLSLGTSQGLERREMQAAWAQARELDSDSSVNRCAAEEALAVRLESPQALSSTLVLRYWSRRGALEQRKRSQRLLESCYRQEAWRLAKKYDYPCLDSVWIDARGVLRGYLSLENPSPYWREGLFSAQRLRLYVDRGREMVENKALAAPRIPAGPYLAYRCATVLWLEDALAQGCPACFLDALLQHMARREQLYLERTRRTDPGEVRYWQGPAYQGN